jgi:galactokinase
VSADPAHVIDPGAFLDRGFDPAEAVSRAALMRMAVNRHRAAGHAAPRWAWFVPGRIEIFGKHTDYAGGRSLLAAVPRGFAVVASPRTDGIVRVEDARYGGTVEVDPLDTEHAYTGWQKYVAVVARRLALNFPGAALGTDIVIASDLPRAAGVSSSSAFVVGLAGAIAGRAGLAERPEWQAAIRAPEDLAGYLGAVENGLTFGSLASASGVGTHGGSEDHTAILTCQIGRVSAYSYVPVVHQGEAVMPPDWAFLVLASGIEADKAGSARDKYNRASLGTRALLDLWSRAHGPRPTLSAALASGTAAETALRHLVATESRPDFSADELSMRLSHFLAEDARVPAALLAFRDEDAGQLGELSAASQTDAERWLGNQIPETSALVAIARESGAFGATSFGAGFGGSVWALARRSEAEAVGERTMRRYREQFPRLDRTDWFVVRPSSGAIELPVGEGKRR